MEEPHDKGTRGAGPWQHRLGPWAPASLALLLWLVGGCSGGSTGADDPLEGVGMGASDSQDTDGLVGPPAEVSGEDSQEMARGTDAEDAPDGGTDGASSGSPKSGAPVLHVEGPWFRDPQGRVVLLRGVNVAGNAKVPPFGPWADEEDLDRLVAWGMNLIRLLFVWEAYEEEPESYDEGYLEAFAAVAEAASARGIHVIVDIHQDGYSRYLSGGCGSGFPLWSIPPDIPTSEPDNSGACHDWALQMILDPDVHGAFGDFYADTWGARTRYLEMLSRVAQRLALIPGVVGYDPLNEPWGWEDGELAPLYEDAAAAIRGPHPGAVLFLEGHLSTNNGVVQSQLPKPSFDNVAYAPHFYDSLAVAMGSWSGLTTAMDLGFATMAAKAQEWGAPLLVGELGFATLGGGARAYVDALYDHLDQHLASSAQWNYTPAWTPETKDGWNGEDFSLVDETGAPRETFRYRPYPQHIAGTPMWIAVDHGEDPQETTLAVTWDHAPEQGATEIYVPEPELYGDQGACVLTQGPELACAMKAARLLACTSPVAATMDVVVCACAGPGGGCGTGF